MCSNHFVVTIANALSQAVDQVLDYMLQQMSIAS
jgi:hypothetical protein